MTDNLATLMSGLPCPYCSGEFSAPSEELLFTHIRLVHSCDPGFSIQCAFSGCLRTFSNFKAYQNHRRLKHSSISVTEDSQPMPGPSADVDELDHENDPHSQALVANAPSTEEMQSYAAKWILQTRETRKLTRIAMQGVIEDVGDLVTFVSETLESQTQAVLRANGVNPELIPGLKEVFCGAATTPFKDLQSFHQQLQYCRKHFNFIVSYTVHTVCTKVQHMYILYVHALIHQVYTCTFIPGTQENCTETNTYAATFRAYEKACHQEGRSHVHSST